jgi:hypothetical protein
MKSRTLLIVSASINILFLFYFVYRVTSHSCPDNKGNQRNSEFNERYFSNQILKGDISAFDAYENFLLKNDRPLEILPYAIYLSNKYNYPRAYSVVGLVFEDIGNLIDTSRTKRLNALDIYSKEYAIKYFSVARRMNEPNAINYFNRHVINPKDD